MQQNAGITLIELLVSVLLIAILLGMASVQWPALAAKRRLQADVDQFVSLISTARHTAIIKGVVVTLCPAAADGCGSRNTWHNGTMAFEDLNGNRVIDGQDAVIRRLPRMPATRVAWRAFRNRGYLRFNPSGMTDWQNGHFLFCPVNGDIRHARQLVLNFAGRVYLSNDADDDGVHEDVRGRPLECV